MHIDFINVQNKYSSVVWASYLVCKWPLNLTVLIAGKYI